MALLLQCAKTKERWNLFCLFLTNYWYDNASKHLELWIKVSKTLHKSINPVSWLFTILEPFSPERSKNPPKTKDLLFIQKCWQTLRDVFWHQIEAFTIDLCKKSENFTNLIFFAKGRFLFLTSWLQFLLQKATIWKLACCSVNG